MNRTAVIVAVLLLAVVGWQQYQIHQIKLQVAKAQSTAEFAIGLNKITKALVDSVEEQVKAESRAH